MSSSNKKRTILLNPTKNSKCGIGRDCSSCVLSHAAVDANVLCFDIYDEKYIVLWHDVHTPFPGSWEVNAPVFLPSDLRRRVTNSSTLKPCRCTGADAQVHWHFGERGQHWKRVDNVGMI